MTEKQPVKPKLVHSDKPKVRPERGILAGGYDRLLMSDEELAEEEKAMDQAQQQERRKHLKSVDSE